MIGDKQMFAAFKKLSNFHPDDVIPIYHKYLHRVETLMGHDIARQYNDLLSKSKDGVLEQLRAVKVKNASKIKAGTKRKRKRTEFKDFVLK